MKTLIIYASKYGATKTIAEQLAIEIGKDAEVKNIRDGRINLKAYDTIIIGGPVYMNKLNKRISSFTKRHEKELLKKRFGLFIGCYTAPCTEGYLEQFFSPALLEKATAKDILGGLMQYDKMNFIYRKIFQSLKKIDDFNKNFIEPKIETERIKEFAQKF